MTKPDQKPGAVPVGVGVKLQVHSPQGVLVDERCIDDDITLDNFMKWFTAILQLNGLNNVNVTLDQMDATGTDRTLAIYQVNGSTTFFNVNGGFLKVQAGDGGGSTPTPVRSNFKLVNLIQSIQCSPATRSVNITSIGGSGINSGATYTLREVGLSAGWFIGAVGVIDFLLFHDAVADLSVPNGFTLTITYSFTWP